MLDQVFFFYEFQSVISDFSSKYFGWMQVESVLDKDAYTLEELLDEDEIIQECKALNSRLINL